MNARCLGCESLFAWELREVRDGNGIEPRERRAIVHFWRIRIRVATRNGHTRAQVVFVHNRKASQVIPVGLRYSRDRIQIQLRPAKSKDSAQNAHEMIFQIGQRAGCLRALTIEHHESVCKVTVDSECVDATEGRICEAITACAGADEGVGDRTIRVVDDADRLGGRRGFDIEGQGDAAVRIQDDVCTADILRQLPTASCGNCCCGDLRPAGKSVGHKRIRIRSAQQRA